MKFAHWLALFVAGALVAVGCGEDRGASSTSTSTNETSTSSTSSEPEVEVGLKEWKVIVEAPSVGAGHVKFDADNEGKVPHELVVLETDTRAADLKVQGGKAKPEGETVGHIADVAPGAKKAADVDLQAGHYVLLCNLPGHYQQGMYADLDVK